MVQRRHYITSMLRSMMRYYCWIWLRTRLYASLLVDTRSSPFRLGVRLIAVVGSSKFHLRNWADGASRGMESVSERRVGELLAAGPYALFRSERPDWRGAGRNYITSVVRAGGRWRASAGDTATYSAKTKIPFRKTGPAAR